MNKVYILQIYVFYNNLLLFLLHQLVTEIRHGSFELWTKSGCSVMEFSSDDDEETAKI